MRFTLEVGNETEKVLLEYSSNQLLGSTIIKVNDQEIKKTNRIFSGPWRESHDLQLGVTQPFSVRIEKERKLFGEINRVFVDGRLVRCYEGL